MLYVNRRGFVKTSASVAFCFVPFSPMTSSTKNWLHLYQGHEKTFSPGDIILDANVVHGFNRGSKDLGFPTANLDMAQLGEKATELEPGIYYGTATLKETVYPTVVSVGWNPFYKNEKKTIEAHLLHKFEQDFYDERLIVQLRGYLRPEANFESLDDLISAINSDIEIARQRLVVDK